MQNSLPAFEVRSLEALRYKIEGLKRMAADLSLPPASRQAAAGEMLRLRAAYVRAMLKAANESIT